MKNVISLLFAAMAITMACGKHSDIEIVPIHDNAIREFRPAGWHALPCTIFHRITN